MSRGLWYLHGHHPPIVHRDLSPNNVLLTSHFVAKISDLGVAKVIQAESRKTKTRAPGTVDFMPPEALLEIPEYGPPLDVFSYGGVILHVVNQEWPKPLHYVMTDPKTGKVLGLTEVERRQQYIKKMAGTLADLQVLVKQSHDNQPSRRPPISNVSERMKRMKEVESMRCPHVNMNPITWQQVEQPLADSQVDFFSKRVKWEELAPLPVGRTAHTAVLLGGVVYAGGGVEGRSIYDYQDSYRLDVYNITTNQWSPSPITTPYCWFAMTVLDDKLVIAGGRKKNNDETVKKVLILNAGQWKDYSEMPTARYNATAVGYHSMLIVVGGVIKVEGKWTVASTTELLDTTNGCWYTCNNLPSPHQQMKAAIVNDKLYLLGARRSDNDLKPSPQVFVASLDTLSTHQLNWQSAPNTPWCGSAPVLCNKFLLTVGGRQQSRTSEVCIFNSSTGQWKHLTNIPAARSGSAVVGVADDILVIGGITNNYEYSNTVWISII